MSVYPNVTKQDMINLRKLADQQKNQRALKIKNRILKQTHDEKLAETLSPINKKLDYVNNTINESTKQLVKKSDIVDGNTQTPAIQNIIGTQSLRDTLALTKRSNNFFKLEEKHNGDVFWNGVFFNHLEKIKLVLKMKNMI